MSRRAQNAVRDGLVAAALAERPRRRRRSALAIAIVATLLGATAAAEATGLLAVGEPIESLHPREATEHAARYQAPHGAKLVVTAADPDSRYGWGASIYTTAKGEDCVLAGQVRGNTLGLERDGRFHPYGPGVVGACGDLDRLPLMSDHLRIAGPHPRTVLFGRTSRPGPVTFAFRGQRRSVRPGPGGTFLLVFDGAFRPGDLTLIR